MEVDVIACTVDAADGDDCECHVGRIECVAQNDGGGSVTIGDIDL